jgi:3-hydroxyacyl-CoA dehydrogenase / enoyl-CoA hydratase / 3-hydroxybutyryl-CoA epimerase
MNDVQAPMKTKSVKKTPSAAAAFSVKRRDDGIAVVEMNVPGEAQNTLKAEFDTQFRAALAEAQAQPGLKGLIMISTKPGSFLAGADLNMIDAAASVEEVSQLSRTAQAAFQQLEDFPVPVVAAIDGACLGGGLELALACRGRIASSSGKTVLGLPESMLGLLPGAGGTVRLPRLIGLAKGLDLLLGGKQLRPKQALKLGLVDEVVPADVLMEAAVRRVSQLAAGRKPAASLAGKLRGRVRKARKGAAAAQSELAGLVLEDNAAGRRLLFQQARKQLLAKTRGNYPAQERILSVVETAYREGIAAGYAAESLGMGELAFTPQSQALRGIFHATNALKKETFVAAGVQPRPVRKVGVLGGGLMGAGIALVTANKAALPVRVKDRDDQGVAHAHGYLRKFYDKRVARGAMSRFDAAAERARMTGTTDYSGFADCDIVVEAVFEDLKLKHQMLHDIERECRADTIFASNTSSIPITRIAEAAKRPENVIGMHYFSPVDKMPLLEVITTRHTAPEVVSACVALGKAQGKTVFVVKDGPGFYTTRILVPYLNEVSHILGEGVSPLDIDRTLVDAGFPVGPVTLMDEVGIDVGTKVGPVLEAAFGERMKVPAQAGQMIAAGFLGRKAGKGFYLYQAGPKSKKKPLNPGLQAVLGIRPGSASLPEKEIVDRCVLMLVNEAVYALQDGILQQPMHGDIGAVFGIGFLPQTGGPFRYIDQLGAGQVVARLEEFAAKHGPRFKPAPMLMDMARKGRKFHP